MFKLMIIVATVVLALHGLIHLMGTTAYLRLAEIQALPYKTTVLGGNWNLGTSGIAVYGALWAVAAAYRCCCSRSWPLRLSLLGFIYSALA